MNEPAERFWSIKSHRSLNAFTTSITASSRWEIKKEESKSCLIREDCDLLFEHWNCSAVLACVLPMTILYWPFSSEYFCPVVLMQTSVKIYSETVTVYNGTCLLTNKNPIFYSG